MSLLVQDKKGREADKQSSKSFFACIAGFYDLKTASVLDAFTRVGDLTLSQYFDLVGVVDGCEWDIKYAEEVQKLYEFREFHHGCAYKFMEATNKTYDMVVLDAPQGCHYDYKGSKCFEHLQALENMHKLCDSKLLVVIYLNTAPDDKDVVGSHGQDVYESYDYTEWMMYRQSFFGSSVNTLEGALHRYRQFFKVKGLLVRNITAVPCLPDFGTEVYGYRVCFELEKVGNP